VGEIVAAEASVKHPLQNCWAFWYYKNDKSRDWLENQKIITKFDTVEDFWA
jgi:translation initiation factor 4E